MIDEDNSGIEHSTGTVLMVDDVATNLEILFNFLQDAGFRVLVARNGQSAIQRAAYARPDIILLDVMMPGSDGFETCRCLKENETTREIPVVFMTALGSPIDKVKGLELGAVDYVTKPIQPEELLARVQTHLTLHNLQKRLQEQISKHEKLIADLDAFVHTVAHDLKSPLSTMLGYVGMLLEEIKTIPQQQRVYLRALERSGYRMSNIIDALLLLATTRHGDFAIERLDMAQLLRNTQDRLHVTIEHAQAQVKVAGEWPAALGYTLWIEEVWVNYLSNAIKYGGQPPRIEVGGTVEDGGMVRFWVQDNGRGLTPEERAKLFVPFSRVGHSKVQGHGLGLSIVKRIIEKLGGEVGVESEVGQGALFYFTLPAAS